MAESLSRAVLWLFVINLGVAFGAGLYEGRIMVSHWLISSPETGLHSGSATDLTLGHNVRTPEEVNALMQRAVGAGARVVKPAGETFWGGYSGYFQDPDGHVWEVAWNPKILPPD